MKFQKRIVALVTALALLLACALAAAGEKTMVLPRDLKTVEASAFEGDTSISNVILPEGVTEILDKAFAGSALKQINLPASLTYIAKDAFDGPSKVAVKAPVGSYAYRWALDNGYIADYPESEHPYASNSNVTWTYKHPTSAAALSVTFSKDTEFEDNSDTLTVKDSNGAKQVFSGLTLAGRTLVLPGKRFDLTLKSDDLAEYYGFAITEIYAMTKKEYEAWLEHEWLYPYYTEARADGTLSITGYKGSDAKVKLPESIDGVTVTAIGANAFKDHDNLTDVTIPASVNSIHQKAFAGLSSLTIHADAGTYAYKWAVTHGYIDTKDKLTVLPSADDGTVAFGDDAIRWENLTGAGMDIQFSVKATAKWTVKSDSDWVEGASGSQSYPATNKSCTLYLTRNETGKARTATLTFTCGKVTEKVVVTQLPFMASSLLNGTQSMVYKAGKDISLEWKTFDDAADYVFYYCSHSYMQHTEYPVTVKNGKAVVTIPAADLEPGQEGHVFYMYVVDRYGHRYVSDSYTFFVNDSAATKWGYRLEYFNGKLSAVITHYYGKDKTLTLPTKLGGYPVVRIADDVFSGNATLQTVTVPSGVVEVGAYAFDWCRALTTVTFPKTVKTFGWSVFSGCEKLTTVTLPSTLTAIEGGMFQGCSALTGLTIPKTVKRIGRRAFDGCSSLKKLELPSGVTAIEEGAFSYCDAFEAIYVPASVTQIEDEAFNGCSNLTIYGVAGSDIAQYAENHGLTFKAGKIPA